MVATQVQPAPFHESQEPLSEARFWNLIALLDWSDPSDEAAVAAPLTAALAALPPGHIQQFQDLLAEKLWHLDTAAHARASLGNDASKHLSVDYFLYDRCYVVARGQAFYEKVLCNPAEFPVGRSFEELLYVAAAAYQKQTGGEVFSHLPAYDYETYSNENGWPEA